MSDDSGLLLWNEKTDFQELWIWCFAVSQTVQTFDQIRLFMLKFVFWILYIVFCILHLIFFWSETVQTFGRFDKKILSTNSCENNFPLLRLNPSLSESSKSNQIQSNEFEDFSTSSVTPAKEEKSPDGGFVTKNLVRTWIRTRPLLRFWIWNLMLDREIVIRPKELTLVSKTQPFIWWPSSTKWRVVRFFYQI